MITLANRCAQGLTAAYDGSENNGKIVLLIDDFDAAVFTQLVEFVHTGTVAFSAETVIGRSTGRVCAQYYMYMCQV
jgi:hypothetical protein